LSGKIEYSIFLKILDNNVDMPRSMSSNTGSWNHNQQRDGLMEIKMELATFDDCLHGKINDISFILFLLY